MTERESQEVIRMVESTWSVDFGIQGRTIWAQMLYPFEAELATAAVAEMSTYPLPSNRSKPQVADLRSVIQRLRADRRAAALPQQTYRKREKGVPEWVWVWRWAQNERAPRCLLAFPQQEGHVSPDDMMTMADYEKLREEWVAAGSPKAASPLPLPVLK